MDFPDISTAQTEQAILVGLEIWNTHESKTKVQSYPPGKLENNIRIGWLKSVSYVNDLVSAIVSRPIRLNLITITKVCISFNLHFRWQVPFLTLPTCFTLLHLFYKQI